MTVENAMRKPFIAGNWKMNLTIAEAVALVSTLKELLAGVTEVEIAVAPPFTMLQAVATVIANSNIKLAAQNMFWEESGAYTGAISPLMLKDADCQYTIIGHSERRSYFGETDVTVNKKIKAALKHQLTPIICVGESLADREAGEVFTVLKRQLEGAFAQLTISEAAATIVAYEPLWAIGTGKTATPEIADETHGYIRQELARLTNETVSSQLRILYGGSVKPQNVKTLMAQPHIDGALVGGASLKADVFANIVKY